MPPTEDSLPQIRSKNEKFVIPDELADRAKNLAGSARSDNTKKAYKSDWKMFADWCYARDLAAVPADPRTVALYLTDLSTRCKASTIARKLTAIAVRHRDYGEESPAEHAAVRAVMSGIRRTLRTPPEAKRPLVVDVLTAALPLPDSPVHIRDRALILIGFAAALRRSELVALRWEDVTQAAEGIILRIRSSKTDQEGASEYVGIPYTERQDRCAARALEHWHSICNRRVGPIFTSIRQGGSITAKVVSDRFVARLVKRCVAAAGYDPSEYSGHSLRAGFATSAAHGGAEEREIMRQTRHRSVMTVRRYIREGSIFRANPLHKTGL